MRVIATLMVWSVCLTVTDVKAQSSIQDVWSAETSYSIGATEAGAVSMAASSDIFEWRLFSHDTYALPSQGSKKKTAQLVIDRPGSISHLGSRRFLVSGSDSSTSKGYLLVVACAVGPNLSVTVEQTVDCGALFDPTGLPIIRSVDFSTWRIMGRTEYCERRGVARGLCLKRRFSRRLRLRLRSRISEMAAFASVRPRLVLGWSTR